MKRVLSAVVIALLMILSYAVGWRHSAGHATASVSAGRVLYWVDPMHPDYKSDHPGSAPDCGMQLKPVYAEAADSTAASSLRPRAISVDLEKQTVIWHPRCRRGRDRGKRKPSSPWPSGSGRPASVSPQRRFGGLHPRNV